MGTLQRLAFVCPSLCQPGGLYVARLWIRGSWIRACFVEFCSIAFRTRRSRSVPFFSNTLHSYPRGGPHMCLWLFMTRLCVWMYTAYISSTANGWWTWHGDPSFSSFVTLWALRYGALLVVGTQRSWSVVCGDAYLPALLPLRPQQPWLSASYLAYLHAGENRLYLNHHCSSVIVLGWSRICWELFRFASCFGFRNTSVAVVWPLWDLVEPGC